VRWLKKHGYTFVSADDVIAMLRDGKPTRPGSVWLSFDDGWRGILTSVVPLSRYLGIPITLFIPSGIIEGDGRFPFLHDPNYPGAAPVRKAFDAGTREAITIAELTEIGRFPEVTIGSHTVTHSITPYCTKEELAMEIGESKRKLESWIGRAVNCFAYPEGKFDGRERQFLIQYGFELAVTTQSAFITAAADRFAVPRFSIGDDISFPQAICSMVGVWRPLVDSCKVRMTRNHEHRPHPGGSSSDRGGPVEPEQGAHVPADKSGGPAQKSEPGVMQV
jgi:peptidoglycan/xylan/chitin deacetylase (PgdA/CDA1 family)